MGAITIRAAEPGDYDTLGRLTVDAYVRVDPSVLDDGYGDELADVAGRAAEVPVLVAVAGERLLGCVTYLPGPDTSVSEFDDPDAASIRHLAVAGAAQGKGVGRLLVQTCVERARRDGRRRVVLHTLETMAAARALYDSLGFVRDESLDQWWGDVQGLGYRLELEASPPP